MKTIKEMLAEFKTGNTFSLVCVSYNRKKKSGGKLITYEEAQLLQKAQRPEEPQRAATALEEKRTAVQEALAVTKNPSHREWYTRNIRILQDGVPTTIVRKIHPALVIKFNNQPVVP